VGSHKGHFKVNGGGSGVRKEGALLLAPQLWRARKHALKNPEKKKKIENSQKLPTDWCSDKKTGMDEV